MWVTGLVATGDNRMFGGTVHLDDGGVNDGSEFFRGERGISIYQAAIFSDLRGSQRLHGFGHTDLGHGQGGAELSDFIGGLQFPFGKKVSRLGGYTDSISLQLDRKPMWKIKWHRHATDAFLPQHAGKDFGQPRALHAIATEFLLVRAECEDVAPSGLFARPINLQIAHHEIPA